MRRIFTPMKTTISHDPREPLSDVVVSKGNSGLAIIGQPGWLEPIPKSISWYSPGLGVQLYDERSNLIGSAPTDSIEDFEESTRVFLLTFDGIRHNQHGAVPLTKRKGP
jgi:hypothetical protein